MHAEGTFSFGGERLGFPVAEVVGFAAEADVAAEGAFVVGRGGGGGLVGGLEREGFVEGAVVEGGEGGGGAVGAGEESMGGVGGLGGFG